MTTRPLLCVSLACSLLACGGSKSEKTAPAEDKRAQPEADADADADAEADAKPEAEAEPEGYEAYLLTALDELGAGKPLSKAETKAYGCSVKYAEAGGEAQAKVGEPAPAFSLPNLEGEPVALADFAGKTVVIEWFNPDCPFVKYAHDDGPLADLAKQQTDAGVVWLAINSGAPGKQGHGAERNKQAKQDWSLPHPVLLDEDGEVGHAYGATNTPHLFVIDKDGKLVYAGALDNAPLGRVEG